MGNERGRKRRKAGRRKKKENRKNVYLSIHTCLSFIYIYMQYLYFIEDRKTDRPGAVV